MSVSSPDTYKMCFLTSYFILQELAKRYLASWAERSKPHRDSYAAEEHKKTNIAREKQDFGAQPKEVF